MTTEDALLAAVAANPADDLPRLVYADWCDENGRPVRAEFIRLQLEIAKKETLPRPALNAFAYLWQRQQEILDHHSAELTGERLRASGAERFEFRRGFVSDVIIPARFITGYNDAITDLTPPPDRIRVTEAAEDVFFFFQPDAPVLARITDLSLPLTRDDGDDEGQDEPAPVQLRPTDAARIRTCSTWPRLRALDLENCRLGGAGVRELFRPPAFPALLDLDLSFNDLTDAGVIDLLNTGLPQRLRRLVLGGNPIGDQAAMELADRLGPSRTLESLNLRMTNIGTAGRLAVSTAFGGRADLF